MNEKGDGPLPIPARPEASGQGSGENDPEAGSGEGQPIPETPGSGIPEDNGRRPTPVRLAMESGEDEAEVEDLGRPRVIEDPASGERWIVTVGGRSASGILPLRTVPIMELNFAREDLPKEIRQAVLCFGKELSEVSDHELLDCLREAGPFREPMRPLEDGSRPGRLSMNGDPLRG